MAKATKEALSKAFKALMQEKTLVDITVRDLTDYCGLNRQTFYYHFHDINELIVWMYSTESYAVVKEYIGATTWQQGFLKILHYIIDNKSFILNTYENWDKGAFEQMAFEFGESLLEQVMAEVAKEMPLVTQGDQQMLVRFYSYGFVGIVKDWLVCGAQEPPQQIVERLGIVLEGSFEAGLIKLRQMRTQGILF